MKKQKKLLSLLMLAALLAGTLQTKTAAHAADSPYVVSLLRAAYASSSENGYVSADYAFDGNMGTRWSSEWTGSTQWLYVDLGIETQITELKIYWEGAHALSYRIQYSNDELNWQDQYQTTASDGGLDEIQLNGSARYVRLLCEEKMMAAYGYSVYEMEVYGFNSISEPPKEYGPNIALGRPVTASTESTIWWLEAYYPEGAALAANAVDGNPDTMWRSGEEAQEQWITVDLGGRREIGCVSLSFDGGGAARYYDIEVSDDGINWSVLYRETEGTGGLEVIPVYAFGQYVRMKGYGKNASVNGFWLKEFGVYDYIAGNEKPVYAIQPLPYPQTVSEGPGSYLTNDMAMPQPRLPEYISSSLLGPVPSNDWWQSLLIDPMGNMLNVLPLKLKYSKQGLGMLRAGSGWLSGRSVLTERTVDFYLLPSGINAAKAYNEVAGYGDFHVKAAFRDDGQIGMESTIVKGSPYVYHTFMTDKAEIYADSLTSIFGADLQPVLLGSGDVFTADHIGLEITDSDNQTGSRTSVSYYSINAPEGTQFRKIGNKIQIQFPGENRYLSTAAMMEKNQLEQFYQNGYAFVTDTHVQYVFDENTSEVITTYSLDTELKRAGFTNQVLQSLLPHQWKKTDAAFTAVTYPSIRGDLKLMEGNSFTTRDIFYGMVPQFTLPDNDAFSRELMMEYLDQLDESTSGGLSAGDAYWQGKSLHPLAMGVLAADQLGEGEYMGVFLSRLKTILEDWLVYSGPDDACFLYYDPVWGTMYYRNSEFGANVGITDHHFTYGYLMFAATVLAVYDNAFYLDYKDMIEHMIRDYANPSDNDPLYPRFRSYDLYEGHSWAGGYADNDDGNNQEAAGESLFGWVGEYLWGVKTGNKTYRDAAVFGFTTELNAVLQYWFNYDGDNWIADWTHQSVGQVYGGTNFFGTFFHGDPVYIYGIHWLPTAEYLSYYGMNQDAAADLYQGLLEDVRIEQAANPEVKIDGPDEVWQHITWPIQSLTDPGAVLAKWDAAKTQYNETFNTYWFIHNMESLGKRTEDIYALGGASASVYEKDGMYQALVWNPGDVPLTVTFRGAAGIVGSVTVKEKALVKINPLQHYNDVVGNPTAPVVEEEYIPVTDGINLAAGKNAYASSSENAGTEAGNTTDGILDTRWSSAYSDEEWIYVDLEGVYNVTAVNIHWEGAYAKKYEIYTSLDGENWVRQAVKKQGRGGIELTGFAPAPARYVKIQGLLRALPFGYSMWEMEVFQTPSDVEYTLLSEGKAISASSEENAGTPAVHANDGDESTRWSSAFTDNEQITIDLGGVHSVGRVQILWEPAYAEQYLIQVSENGVDYTTVYTVTDGDGGLAVHEFPKVTARYVRMQGLQRALPYGFSLFEFRVFG